MGNSAPYRQPCPGTIFVVQGPKWQNAGSNSIADKYTNTTLVANWDTGVGGMIPPYERFTRDSSASESCEIHYSGNGAPYDAGWPLPYPANTFHHTAGDKVDFKVCHKRGFKNVQARRSWHGAWPWTAGEAGCPSNICPDSSGYRAYQAAPTTTKYLTATYDVHWHWQTIGEPIDETVDKTGVRSVNALSGEITSSLITTETYQQDPGTGFVTTYYSSGGAGYHADSDGTHTDDFDSGGTTDLDTFDEGACFPQVNPDASGFGTIATFAQIWNAGIDDGTFTGTHLPLMTDPNSYSGSATRMLTGGGLTDSADLTFSRTATTLSWDFTHVSSGNTSHYYGSITLSDANTSTSVYNDLKENLLVLWPLNDDKLYPWRGDLKTGLAPVVTRNELANVSPLGFNTYTVDDYASPIGTAPYSSWNQRAWFDPNAYQWVFPAGDDQTTAAATDLLKIIDGTIRGAPNPAGYQNYFDFAFNDIRGCCYRPSGPPGPGYTAWDWYQVGWGMFLADQGGVDGFNTISSCSIPLNATQWNNWFQAVNKPMGAWIFYADKADYFPSDCLPSTEGSHSGAGDAGQLVAQKWAECLETWHSQNFARPGGADKFLWDETKVYCISDITGSGEGTTGTLTDPITGLAPPDDIDTTGYWGGPSVGGFFAIASYSGGTVTLGAQQYDVPTGFVSKSNGDEMTAFGKMRYPTEPSLLGRAAVTTNAPGTDFIFSDNQPYFGLLTDTHQESIDLYDANMTLLAAAVTATRVDDTHFTIVAGQPTAVWVQIHGSPKWYMNDNDSKGDYVELEWTSDFRSSGEYGRLTGILDCSGTQVARPTANAGGGDVQNLFSTFNQTACCIGFSPCGPRVVCISPNGETFPNGHTYAFPETFIADETYGSKWWGYVQQTMTDLLWQQPHRPCNIETCAKWLMDDATCHGNSPLDCPAFCCPGDDGYIDGESVPPVYYYGFTPLVEARIAVPSVTDCSKSYGPNQDESGPAVPGDVQIGWLSPVTHGVTEANVAFPPPSPGIESDTGRPGNVVTPWNIHDLLCASAVGGCRFNYATPDC